MYRGLHFIGPGGTLAPRLDHAAPAGGAREPKRCARESAAPSPSFAKAPTLSIPSLTGPPLFPREGRRSATHSCLFGAPRVFVAPLPRGKSRSRGGKWAAWSPRGARTARRKRGARAGARWRAREPRESVAQRCATLRNVAQRGGNLPVCVLWFGVYYMFFLYLRCKRCATLRNVAQRPRLV